MNVVLDSNILLHYASFEDIPWESELGQKDVVIVLTAIVLEEIDKKKDQEKGKVQKRAKQVSSRIGEILIDGKSSKVPVKYVESSFATDDEKARYNLGRNDNRILFDISKFGLNAADVIVVSNDNAMLIRAKNLGYGIHRLNDKYLLKEELTKEEKEAKAAIAELERLKSRMPEPKLVFENSLNFLHIERIAADDLDLVVRREMDDLRARWPEKKIEDEQQYIFGQIYNNVTPEMVLQYNISRTKFLELSEKKVRLEAQSNDLAKRLKRIAINIVNGGTASTGRMNVFLEVPDNVQLYYKNRKKKVEYEQPATPNYYPALNSIANLNLALGHYVPGVEMWNLDDYIQESELRYQSDALTHGLQSKAFEFYVDAATCLNFKMNWVIVDAALIEPVKGELNVSFIEQNVG